MKGFLMPKLRSSVYFVCMYLNDYSFQFWWQNIYLTYLWCTTKGAWLTSVFRFQDQLCGRQSGMSDELNHILQELTALNRHENAKVALRARQVSCDESASFC